MAYNAVRFVFSIRVHLDPIKQGCIFRTLILPLGSARSRSPRHMILGRYASTNHGSRGSFMEVDQFEAVELVMELDRPDHMVICIYGESQDKERVTGSAFRVKNVMYDVVQRITGTLSIHHALVRGERHQLTTPCPIMPKQTTYRGDGQRVIISSIVASHSHLPIISLITKPDPSL